MKGCLIGNNRIIHLFFELRMIHKLLFLKILVLIKRILGFMMIKEI